MTVEACVPGRPQRPTPCSQVVVDPCVLVYIMSDTETGRDAHGWDRMEI